MASSRPNGAVIYEGPSRLDGAPIVVVAVGLHTGSSNRKTGAMVQTHILRADRAPLQALRDGADRSICGACPHRPDPSGKRSCYVNVGQGPTVVWKTYKRGGYPTVTDPRGIAALGRGRRIRLGSYGDPAAVPTYVWGALTTHSLGHTGYTHQIRHEGFDPQLLDLCMVSADTPGDLEYMRRIHPGARAFYVRPAGAPIGPGMAQCPAAAEAGRRVQCAACMLCGGAAVKARSVSIEAHGPGKRYVGERLAVVAS